MNIKYVCKERPRLSADGHTVHSIIEKDANIK